MDKYDPEYIDADEKELIESIGDVDPETLQKPSDELNRRLKDGAREYLKKHETKMNIRIDPEELEQIKKRAAREGLKYQALVKSVLHKYITGQLVDSTQKQKGNGATPPRCRKTV